MSDAQPSDPGRSVPEAPAASRKSRGGSVRALQVGIFMAIFATAFEGISVATAMPAAAADLGKIELYAWAFTLYMVGILIATVIAGRVADRDGPLRSLAAGGAVFAVGLVVSGLAPTMEQLLIGRLIQGFGVGALNLSIYVVIALAFAEKARAAMMSLVSAAWVLPSLVGPWLAGLLTRTFSWHWVFLGVLPWLVVAALLMGPPLRVRQARFTRGDRSETNPAPVWTGVVLALGAVAVQFAGQRAGRPETRDLWALLALVVGVALLAVALPRLMPRRYLTLGRGMPSVMSTRALIAGSFFGAEAFIPLMLVRLRGLDIAWAGAILTVASLGWALGAWLQAQSWLRLSRDQMIVFGAVGVTIGIAGSALVPTLPALPVWVALIPWTCAGLGMGFAIASTGLATMTLSPTAQQGRNNSALQTSEALGNSIIAGLAGTLFAWLHAAASQPVTFSVVLWAMCAVAAWSIVTALRIGPVHDAPPEPQR